MARYTLTQRQKISPTSMLFTFVPSGDSAIGFEPGQYISLRFKRFGRPTPARRFSVINSPNNEGILQIGVRVEGKFTTALSELPTQSEVNIDGPFGQFYLDPSYDKRAVFAAGGIGITPILSIINDVTEQRLATPMTLLYSCRDQSDVPFATDLLRLESENPNLRVVFVISSGNTDRFEQTANVVKGRITPELIARAAGNEFENTSFFVCGPQGFMNSIEKTLRSNGTPDWRINIESFVQAHAVRDSGIGSVRRKFTSVYSVSAIGFVIAMSVIFGTDLFRFVSAEPKPTAATSQTTSSVQPDDDSPVQTPTSGSSDDSASPSSSKATNTTSTSQQTTQPTYTAPMYQRPVSTVS